MNLVTLLEQRACEHPSRPALVDSMDGSDRVISYGELLRRVNAGAAELQRMGVVRGQVVLVFQPVSIELYVFMLAAFHSGVRVMLADPSAGREFLSRCCGRLMPDAFFGSWKAQCLRLLVPGMRRIRKSIVSRAWFPGARRWSTDADGPPPLELPDEEPALITFTSGGTGVPKAALRSHGFLLAQHRVLSRALDFENAEVDLITLPVFVLANLASGLTSVIAATNLARPGQPDAPAIRAQCTRLGVTRCAASPAFFEGLLHSPDDLPAFRKIFTGGAPVFPDLLERLRSALPDAAIHSVYGSTEAEPIAHHPAEAVDEESAAITRSGGGLCAGSAVDEIEVRVISDHWFQALGPMGEDEFSRMSVPIGQAGEVVVAGDHVLRGYLGGVGDEETKIRVEERVWHRTGDAGWFDITGRLWLLGRCAEKLPPFPAPPGLPVDAMRYPFAVECAMRGWFPEFRTAAIDRQGMRVLVVGKSCQADEQSAIRSKAAGLGIEKCIFLEALPFDRRHNAKIDYRKLRAMLENRHIPREDSPGLSG